jgi:2-polyprenyl-3-methyl-5-hydroxy-6-metoxy-1,4-benzoquinol methylase
MFQMVEDRDKRIIKSWSENSELWTEAVRANAIASRRLVTNDAIIKAVLEYGGSRILDVGCGEGWLSNELAQRGKQVTGFDASSDLIHNAKKNNSVSFYVRTYDQFLAQPDLGKDFDIIVFNFSLLSEQIKPLFEALLKITRPGGHLVIQTVHPWSTSGAQRYEDGWREETFASLAGEWSPMPWYFRTLGSWLNEIKSAGWRFHELHEPVNAETGQPASLILVGKK